MKNKQKNKKILNRNMNYLLMKKKKKKKKQKKQKKKKKQKKQKMKKQKKQKKIFIQMTVKLFK